MAEKASAQLAYTVNHWYTYLCNGFFLRDEPEGIFQSSLAIRLAMLRFCERSRTGNPFSSSPGCAMWYRGQGVRETKGGPTVQSRGLEGASKWAVALENGFTCALCTLILEI